MERDARAPSSKQNLVVHNDVRLLCCRVFFPQRTCDISEWYVVRQRLDFPKRSLALGKVKIRMLQKVLLLRHELLRSAFGVAYHLNRVASTAPPTEPPPIDCPKAIVVQKKHNTNTAVFIGLSPSSLNNPHTVS